MVEHSPQILASKEKATIQSTYTFHAYMKDNVGIVPQIYSIQNAAVDENLNLVERSHCNL